MIRPIILFGSPVLGIKSTLVKEEKLHEVKPIIVDMFETMKRANGVGLAAVQIEIPLRIFVIEAHLDDPSFDFKGTFINPTILREWGDPVKHAEGCLSIPQIAAMVERFPNIEIEWRDEEWNYHKEIFDGMKARIIQHEYDHLDGNIYIDRLDLMWKSMLDKPLELISKRKMEVPYSYK